jgi:hypothetical protein
MEGGGDPGQVASLTSKNNFINFCLTQPVELTDGQQKVNGSCNPIPVNKSIRSFYLFFLMCIKDGPYRCQEQAAFVQVCLSTKPRREPEGESNVHVEVVDQEHRNWVLCQSRCQVLFSAAGVPSFQVNMLASWCMISLTAAPIIDCQQQRDHSRPQPRGHSGNSFSGVD